MLIIEPMMVGVFLVHYLSNMCLFGFILRSTHNNIALKFKPMAKSSVAKIKAPLPYTMP